jgi:hypothetical protein
VSRTHLKPEDRIVNASAPGVTPLRHVPKDTGEIRGWDHAMPPQPMNDLKMHPTTVPIVPPKNANALSVTQRPPGQRDAEVVRACDHAILPTGMLALTAVPPAEMRIGPVTWEMIVPLTDEARHQMLNKEDLNETAPPGCKAVDKVHAETVLSKCAGTIRVQHSAHPWITEVRAGRNSHVDKHSAPCRHVISVRCSAAP